MLRRCHVDGKRVVQHFRGFVVLWNGQGIVGWIAGGPGCGEELGCGLGDEFVALVRGDERGWCGGSVRSWARRGAEKQRCGLVECWGCGMLRRDAPGGKQWWCSLGRLGVDVAGESWWWWGFARSGRRPRGEGWTGGAE